MVGNNAEEIAYHIGEMVEYVTNHPEIDNVLLSGGDALINENKRLEQYLEAFSTIEHLDYIRIGTRVPVVLPHRILLDQELLDMLYKYNRRNQTVLLKGINDESSTLAELMNRLTSIGVLPYYVFQCCPAMGVKNQFQVPLLTGQRIVDEAKKDMSGQAKQFRYVMSHVTGKIEILGRPDGEEMLFKYHQAKYEKDASRFFTAKLSEEQCWLPDDWSL